MEQTLRSIDGVVSGIDTCLAHAAQPERSRASSPEVSSWSVAMHVEHLLLADRWILEWVLRTARVPGPDHRAEDPTPIGVEILASGRIPRGRGPAPEMSIPQGLSTADLVDQLSRARSLATRLGPRLTEIHASRATLPHHVLGHFTPAQWLRFAHIHHDHHEAIIHDILT